MSIEGLFNQLMFRLDYSIAVLHKPQNASKFRILSVYLKNLPGLM